MALRLLLSSAVASLVVVGCPPGEGSRGQSRHPGSAPWVTVETPPAASISIDVAGSSPARELESELPGERGAASDPEPGDNPEPVAAAGDEPSAATELVPEAELSSPGELSAAGQRSSRDAPATPAAPAQLADAARPLHRDLQHGRVLGALSKETVVYQAPRRSSRKLGFLRQGARVRREAEPAGFEGCKEGWYRVAPEGYVCVGKTATLDPQHPILTLSRRRADRNATLPYLYGRARYPTPPLYTRLPTREQQGLSEPDLAAHRQRRHLLRPWDDVPLAPLPKALENGERVPRPFGYPVLERSWVSGRALPETGFAFLQFFEHDGRRFGLTTDFSLVPLDRVEPVRASEFHGIILGGAAALPVAFVRSRGAYLYRGDPRKSGLVIERALGHREAVPVTGERVRLATGSYLETRSGHWIRDEHLVRVDPMQTPPSWAKGTRSWIEVSILNQTLVAYEGDEPVYATLVSTGAGGLGDPEETHATIRGTFLIHTKHVTATMSSDEVGDEFDLRDVPYVQYFHEGYAFHAAYWHDSFGRPRSHGCINLSPADARWLFHWTGPAVPRAWHSALSLKEGTLVYIHP